MTSNAVRVIPASRIVACLAIVMLAALSFIFRSSGDQQVFAAFGQAKRVLLPVTYAVFAFAAISARHQPGLRSPLPPWLWLLTVLTAVSYVGSVLLGSPSVDTTGVAAGESLALLLGFSLIGYCGLRAADWTDQDRRRLMQVLLGGAGVAGVLGGLGATPFGALLIPATFACLALFLRAKQRRGRYFLAFAVLSALLLRNLLTNVSPSQPTSSAALAQIVICGAIVALFFVPRAFRVPVIVAGTLGVIFLLVSSSAWELSTGTLRTTDVTIAQRSYEAAVTIRTAQEHTWTLLFGQGPGATVNLLSSPDAGTLLAAGRDLARVDDVHLLSAHLLLKLGLLGLLWAGVLVVALVKVALPCFGERTDENAWRLFLLIFLAAGVVNALPAATNLFTNPLIPLFLGMLWNARGGGESDQPPVQEVGVVRGVTSAR